MSYAFCATTFFVSEETLPDHLVYCVETRILVCVFQVQSVPISLVIFPH